MTLKRIEVRDFQNHRRKAVVLDPEVTVFVGPSRAGKSALVRALYLLCFNKPRGGRYVRHGEKALRVRLAVGRKGGDAVVQATRGKGKNAYHLDGRRFAPERRRDVPQAISHLLNVSEASFQRQDEPHFWLYDSPGQVAKHLNEIADLETMDRVMGRIAAEVRSAADEVKFTKARLAEARTRKAELAWVPAAVRSAGRLARLESAVAVNRARIASVERSAETVAGLRRAADRLSGANVARLAAVRSGRRALAARSKAERLAELVEQVEAAMPAALPGFAPVLRSRKAADEAAERLRRLESLITNIEDRERRCAELERERKAASRRNPETCPTCGRKWPSSASATSTSRTTRPARGRKGAASGTRS